MKKRLAGESRYKDVALTPVALRDVVDDWLLA